MALIFSLAHAPAGTAPVTGTPSPTPTRTHDTVVTPSMTFFPTPEPTTPGPSLTPTTPASPTPLPTTAIPTSPIPTTIALEAVILPSVVSGNPGLPNNIFQVQLKVDTNTSLRIPGLFTMRVSWDPTQITYMSLTNGQLNGVSKGAELADPRRPGYKYSLFSSFPVKNNAINPLPILMTVRFQTSGTITYPTTIYFEKDPSEQLLLGNLASIVIPARINPTQLVLTEYISPTPSISPTTAIPTTTVPTTTVPTTTVPTTTVATTTAATTTAATTTAATTTAATTTAATTTAATTTAATTTAATTTAATTTAATTTAATTTVATTTAATTTVATTTAATTTAATTTAATTTAATTTAPVTTIPTTTVATTTVATTTAATTTAATTTAATTTVATTTAATTTAATTTAATTTAATTTAATTTAATTTAATTTAATTTAATTTAATTTVATTTAATTTAATTTVPPTTTIIPTTPVLTTTVPPTQTATETPVPTPFVDFVFNNNTSNEWVGISTNSFDKPTFEKDANSIYILPSTTNTFGFWTSPTYGPHTTLAGDDAIYVVSFLMSSATPSLSTVPTMRVRANSSDFQTGAVLISTSATDGSYSPPGDGKTYRLYHRLLDGVRTYSLSFDLLNFDPSDAASGEIHMRELTVEESRAFATQSTALSIDFTGASANGWVQNTAAPAFAAPNFNTTEQGLQIIGNADTTPFGYWSSANGAGLMTIDADSVYEARFTITTNAAASARATIPTLRFRINSADLKFSVYSNIESVPANTMPAQGEEKTYSVYFEGDSAVDGQDLLFAFDYLVVGGTGNDPTIGATLSKLEVLRGPKTTN